jgi:hypothetical protein
VNGEWLMIDDQEKPRGDIPSDNDCESLPQAGSPSRR